VGLGTVVPRDTDFVLDNHMGDCKDHATLLQALLAAKGIASNQALVNAGSSYKLPAIPVVSMVNHVINYIPGLDLYVDSTAADVPFGMLPSGDADKPVLLVGGYRDGMRTAAPPVTGNEQVMKTVVDIAADGSVKGEVEVALRGVLGVEVRAQMRGMGKDAETELVKNFFEPNGFSASGSFSHDDTEALTDVHHYATRFEVASFYTMPGSGALPIAPLFYNPAGLAAIMGNEAQRVVESVPVSCSSVHTVEDTYRFPSGVQVISVPPPMTLVEGVLSYSATYVRQGDTLTVRRVFDDRTQGSVCSPETMAAARRFAQKVLPNLRAQVIYQ
jgi:hypothetical protein